MFHFGIFGIPKVSRNGEENSIEQHVSIDLSRICMHETDSSLVESLWLGGLNEHFEDFHRVLHKLRVEKGIIYQVIQSDLFVP